MSAPVLHVRGRSRALPLHQMDAIRTTYAPRRAVSLRLTLAPLAQGRTDPTMQRDATGVWLTLATPTGPASLHLRSVAGAIEATAWGAGAALAVEQVPALCGEHDDDDGFDPSRHPLIADLHRRLPGLRLTRASRILPFLVPTILGQKVTPASSRSAPGASWSLATASRRPAPRRSGCGSPRPPRPGVASRPGSGIAPASARSAPTPS